MPDIPINQDSFFFIAVDYLCSGLLLPVRKTRPWWKWLT